MTPAVVLPGPACKPLRPFPDPRRSSPISAAPGKVNNVVGVTSHSLTTRGGIVKTLHRYSRWEQDGRRRARPERLGRPAPAAIRFRAMLRRLFKVAWGAPDARFITTLATSAAAWFCVAFVGNALFDHPTWELVVGWLVLCPLPWVVLLAWKVRSVRADRRSRRLARGLCLRCGYDLRATPGRCPECGVAAAGEKIQIPDRTTLD